MNTDDIAGQVLAATGAMFGWVVVRAKEKLAAIGAVSSIAGVVVIAGPTAINMVSPHITGPDSAGLSALFGDWCAPDGRQLQFRRSESFDAMLYECRELETCSAAFRDESFRGLRITRVEFSNPYGADGAFRRAGDERWAKFEKIKQDWGQIEVTWEDGSETLLTRCFANGCAVDIGSNCVRAPEAARAPSSARRTSTTPRAPTTVSDRGLRPTLERSADEPQLPSQVFALNECVDVRQTAALSAENVLHYDARKSEPFTVISIERSEGRLWYRIDLGQSLGWRVLDHPGFGYVRAEAVSTTAVGSYDRSYPLECGRVVTAGVANDASLAALPGAERESISEPAPISLDAVQTQALHQ
jgi:hypothetical protein